MPQGQHPSALVVGVARMLPSALVAGAVQQRLVVVAAADCIQQTQTQDQPAAQAVAVAHQSWVWRLKMVAVVVEPPSGGAVGHLMARRVVEPAEHQTVSVHRAWQAGHHWAVAVELLQVWKGVHPQVETASHPLASVRVGPPATVAGCFARHSPSVGTLHLWNRTSSFGRPLGSPLPSWCLDACAACFCTYPSIQPRGQ